MFAACGSSYRSHRPCGSGACPRCRRRGPPAIPRYRSSRTSSLLPRVGAVLARDKGDAVYQTYRVIVPREQVRSYRRSPACWSEACPRCRRRGLPATPCNRPSRTSSLLPPVGAVLARDKGDAVYQTYRVIVHREQARSYRRAPKPVGARLARDAVDAVFQLSSEQMPPKGH